MDGKFRCRVIARRRINRRDKRHQRRSGIDDEISDADDVRDVSSFVSDAEGAVVVCFITEGIE